MRENPKTNSLRTTCVYGPISSCTVGNRLGREKWLFFMVMDFEPPGDNLFTRNFAELASTLMKTL